MNLFAGDFIYKKCRLPNGELEIDNTKSYKILRITEETLGNCHNGYITLYFSKLSSEDDSLEEDFIIAENIYGSLKMMASKL